MSSSFWEELDALIATSKLIIDRPKSGSHPRYSSVIYPLDYGFLEGTSGGDGNGIDVWRGSLSDDHLDAIICTVDPRKRDTEVKLLIGISSMRKPAALT